MVFNNFCKAAEICLLFVFVISGGRRGRYLAKMAEDGIWCGFKRKTVVMTCIGRGTVVMTCIGRGTVVMTCIGEVTVVKTCKVGELLV